MPLFFFFFLADSVEKLQWPVDEENEASEERGAPGSVTSLDNHFDTIR